MHVLVDTRALHRADAELFAQMLDVGPAEELPRQSSVSSRRKEPRFSAGSIGRTLFRRQGNEQWHNTAAQTGFPELGGDHLLGDAALVGAVVIAKQDQGRPAASKLPE